MGRYRLRRTCAIAVPLTAEERAALERIAREQGISLAQTARELMGLREIVRGEKVEEVGKE